MKSKITFTLVISLVFMYSGLQAQDTIQVDYKKYPDYKSSNSGVIYNPAKNGARRMQKVELPLRVDNSEKTHFPAVFNQDQGSCGSASRIGYMFTTEINAYRGNDASLPENIYPTQFTWLLTDHGPGKETMARDNGIPNMISYGGRTYSKLFGNQINEDPFGWMTGYEKWFSAMFNRISGTSNIGPINIKDNADILKGWLWNHNGDPIFKGRGGIAGIGVASAATLGTISSGTYAGQKFVKFWGESVDHALTIIGYDDNIWCDINEDGAHTDNEIGAWIIVNSWGNGWANKGFVYCPYSQSVPTKTSTSFWSPELYHVRPNYRPLKTIKIKMDFSHRSELSLSVGVSSDLNATTPAKQIALSHFTYCGWQKKDGVKIHDVPMLGQWADGVMHTEPMEFGYDLTDLVASFDQSKPLKYFFTITSSAGATGTGMIRECSIMDYSIDKNGIEIPFPDKNVTILNAGKKTAIATTVFGAQQLNSPLNLTWKSTTELIWTKPQPPVDQLVGYNVYKNEVLETTINGANVNSFVSTDAQSGDAYVVTAVYDINNDQIESLPSNKVVKYLVPSTQPLLETGSMEFSDCGFTIPTVFANAMPNCTMEFWLKPTTIKAYSFQIGQAFGSFLFQLNSNGSITAGYNLTSADNYLKTTAKVNVNEWTHIAVVLEGRKIIIYKNGVSIGSIITAIGNGMPAMTTFTVGKNGSNKGITGFIDEFRVWNTALTQQEIESRKDKLIEYPEVHSNLILYYQMDLNNGKLKDSKGSNDATLLCSGTVSATDYPLSQVINDFTLSDTTCTIGDMISVVSTVNPFNTDSVLWTAPEAGMVNYCIEKPTFVFNKKGELSITKTVVTKTGEKQSTTKTINVSGLAIPEPDFKASKDTVLTGERVSFENRTNLAYTSYNWSLVGSNSEVQKNVNAATTYNLPGEYTVTLTATNLSGQKSVSKKIIVQKSAPKAEFESVNTLIVKDDNVKFSNKSLFSPETYKWEFEGGSPSVSTEKDPTITYNHSGKFRVKLTAKNEKGESVIEKNNYIIVLNENPGNALAFDGNDDYLIINGLFSASTSALPFTIEWWMNPGNNKDNCQIFATDVFSIKQNIKGGLSVGFGDTDRMLVDDGTLESGTWNHFAFTFNGGAGVFYKNGKPIATRTFTTKSVSASSWSNGFKVGSAANSVQATIDELRVWKSARTQEELLVNLNSKLKNPTTITNLEVYLNFDESASASPQDYSLNNRQTLRQNIGPVGDMWSASMAFSNPEYAPEIFNPNAQSTYIIYDAQTGKRFNTSASVTYAEYKTEFKEDGTIVGPCGTATAYLLNNKYVVTGSSEFVIAKNGSNLWTLKDVNNNYFVRRDQGYMVSSNTDSRATLTGFASDVFGKVRMNYGAALCVKIDNNQWNNGGSLTDFSFIFEEVIPVVSASNFSEINNEKLQQLRFSAGSQLLGSPKIINGTVSYAVTMANNKWYPVHFSAPLQEITFQGRALSNDTMRLGGRMSINKDYEIRKYENGNLIAVTNFNETLPAGSYLFRLKNSTLGGKKVIFRTSANVQFKDAPTAPKIKSLCGTDMARTARIENVSGYYKINATGDKMIFAAATSLDVAPFEVYIPYQGNVDEAVKEIDLNGEAITGLGTINQTTHKVLVYAINGRISVVGTNSQYSIFALNGMQIGADRTLTRGCYIVLVDNRAYKVIVQ